MFVRIVSSRRVAKKDGRKIEKGKLKEKIRREERCRQRTRERKIEGKVVRGNSLGREGGVKFSKARAFSIGLR